MTWLFVAALAMLVLGHVLRAMRQASLFPSSGRPRPFDLTVGLSLGYAINAITPFRFGEIARAFYASARANQGFGLVGATIVVERVSDLAVVAAILAVLPRLVGGSAGSLAAPVGVMAAVVVATLAAAKLLRSSAWVRALCWTMASLFNDRLRFILVDMAWSTAQLLAPATLLRPRYLLYSVLMWTAYLLAYVLLGAAIGRDILAVVTILLSHPLSPLLGSRTLGTSLALVTSLAALLILVSGVVADRSGIERSFRRVARFGLARPELDPVVSGASFSRQEDYGEILRAHFAGGAAPMASFGLHGLDGAVVQRLLPGGSDAITAVVEDGDRLAIRKFAVGEAADKLAVQARWLKAHAGELPFASVESESAGQGKFHYDMPYLASARDLYEMVHVAPISVSRALLEEIVGAVARWHHAGAAGLCADADLQAYIERKVIANARAALDFAELQLPERYWVNGRELRLSDWKPLLDSSWVASQMPSRETGPIHGDLTIENIVVCPERSPGWYLIDPNPGNLLDTPLIDWAKLMQSLNLGYEALNRSEPASVRGDRIDVMFGRSRIYADLHQTLCGQLDSILGPERRREVAFHEIVNYLRLIPYKMRRHPPRAMTFFAGASVLLHRYLGGGDD